MVPTSEEVDGDISGIATGEGVVLSRLDLAWLCFFYHGIVVKMKFSGSELVTIVCGECVMKECKNGGLALFECSCSLEVKSRLRDKD